MKLAEVLGLDTRKQVEQGLLKADKLLEMISAIAECEQDVKKKDPKAWDPISLDLQKLQKDLDSLTENEFEGRAQAIRDVAKRVAVVLNIDPLKNIGEDKLKQSRLDTSELVSRRKILEDRLNVFGKIVNPLADTPPSTRIADIKQLLKNLQNKLSTVVTAQGIIECEREANEIFAFDAKSQSFDREALKNSLDAQIKLVEPRLKRDGYGHTVVCDIEKAKQHLVTVTQDTTSQVQTLMSHKLGMAICDRVAAQVLDPKNLKLPKSNNTSVTPAIQKLEDVSKNVELLATEVEKLMTTQLEKDEFTQLIKPQLTTLSKSVKQILDPVVALGNRAKDQLPELKQNMSPDVERSVNECFLMLKLAATSAQNQVASNSLLSNWSTCEFFSKENVATQLKTLADL